MPSSGMRRCPEGHRTRIYVSSTIISLGLHYFFTLLSRYIFLFFRIIDISFKSFSYFPPCVYMSNSGPGSSDGIATVYGLEGPGIESRWVRDLPQPSRPSLRSTQPSVQEVPVLSRGKLRPGRGADPSPPSSDEVKNSVELYLYST